jgi:hypothetical protein
VNFALTAFYEVGSEVRPRKEIWSPGLYTRRTPALMLRMLYKQGLRAEEHPFFLRPSTGRVLPTYEAHLYVAGCYVDAWGRYGPIWGGPGLTGWCSCGLRPGSVGSRDSDWMMDEFAFLGGTSEGQTCHLIRLRMLLVLMRFRQAHTPQYPSPSQLGLRGATYANPPTESW